MSLSHARRTETLSYPDQQMTEMSASLREVSFAVREVRDLQPLIDRISSARIVMLGESTHGTEEFYSWRRLITQWLITKHGFDFVAVEADWPDASKIHSYVTHQPRQTYDSARQVLEQFHRWPTWMWANTEIIRMAEWMRSHNSHLPPGQQAGFFGLDVYSLFDSISEVLRYLEQTNPLLARRAKRHYACFERFSGDEIAYARSTLRFPDGCADAVTKVLQDVQRSRSRLAAQDEAFGAYFDAHQNAALVKNAESYYRAMIHGDDRSWNIRDQHMMDTLDTLLNQGGKARKAIVWAHNTHIGDYRATSMLKEGLVNLGGLAREKYGESEVALVGFGTAEGEVIAARAWDGPLQVLRVPPPKVRSCETLYQGLSSELGCGIVGSVFKPRKDSQEHSDDPLCSVLDQRAIGVVYDPEHERSNYVPTALAKRYDAFLHVDRSHALEPLILSYRREEFPDTWPAGS